MAEANPPTQHFLVKKFMESGIKFPRMGRGNGLPLLPLAALGILGVLVLVFFASASPAPAQAVVPSGSFSPIMGGSCSRMGPQSGGGQGQSTVVQAAAAQSTVAAGGAQDIYVKALASGSYDKPSVKVRANQKVRLHFSADPRAGCGRVLIMRDFGVSLVSRNGEEQVAEFTPGPGKYEFSCSMRMFRGVLEAA